MSTDFERCFVKFSGIDLIIACPSNGACINVVDEGDVGISVGNINGADGVNAVDGVDGVADDDDDDDDIDAVVFTFVNSGIEFDHKDGHEANNVESAFSEKGIQPATSAPNV